MQEAHPFDGYAQFTDLQALHDASGRALRKSVRVNTLKTSVEAFRAWAAERQWKLEPVPWCSEGFYIDRDDRSVALGKDLLHLLGHTYMQEAASMLPVELLDPKPGETVLDMSAAPGSKTTQIAAKMKGSGVIIANDVQEKRLWTLKSSLHRCGVTSDIVTKKVGQWFMRHMTERFDRVLCDAPCTAQGTSRKDSDALLYSSDENIGKMARLQRELLEAAVHAAKVGGVIVYSTCTLTLEENEGVISSILNKYSDQVKAQELGPNLNTALYKGLIDSKKVQEVSDFAKANSVRLWPHVYDTEGFFACALVKVAPTRAREPMDRVFFVETPVPPTRQREIAQRLTEQYGTSFIDEGERLFERGDLLILTNDPVSDFHLPVQDYALGLPFGRRLEGSRVRVDHDIATLRGHRATRNTEDLHDAQIEALLDGKDTTCSPDFRGDIVLRYRGVPLGFGLAKDGHLKNRLPRWLVQKS